MRARRTIVSLSLPLPPSVNKAFAARRGSHLTMKTASYRFWEQQVREEHGRGERLPMLFEGARYGLWIDLPSAMRGDIDNRVKLISDVLCTPGTKDYGLGIVLDDKKMRGLHVEHLDGIAGDTCRVTVVQRSDWPGYVMMRMGE